MTFRKGLLNNIGRLLWDAAPKYQVNGAYPHDTHLLVHMEDGSIWKVTAEEVKYD